MPRGLARLLGGLLSLLVFGVTPERAAACSGDPGNPFDPNTAALIAEGWVERVTLRPDLAEPGYSYTPVEVSLRLTRTLKGSAGDTVSFVDYGTAWRRPDGSVLWGSGGACGIMEADPSGRYALIVFMRSADGRLVVNKIFGAAFGSGPDDPGVQQLRQRLLDRLRPSAMPRTGTGDVALRALDLGGLVAGGAVLAVAALAMFSSRYTRRAR